MINYIQQSENKHDRRLLSSCRYIQHYGLVLLSTCLFTLGLRHFWDVCLFGHTYYLFSGRLYNIKHLWSIPFLILYLFLIDISTLKILFSTRSTAVDSSYIIYSTSLRVLFMVRYYIPTLLCLL